MPEGPRQKSLFGNDPPADPAPAGLEPPPVAASIEGWKIFAVDAHSLIFQVFHALPEMTSPRASLWGRSTASYAIWCS